MYTLNKTGFDFIEGFEKFVPTPYKDSGGVWTQGIGSTINMDTLQKIKATDPPIDYETAVRWKKAHIAKYTNPVIAKYINRRLSQNEYNALASFVYNTGGHYLNASGKPIPYNIFERINNREPEMTLRYYWERCAITVNGKPLNGLIRRRKGEAQLYFS